MLKTDVINLSKGIFLDIDPLKQPKDSYRIAYNAVLESRDGNYTDIVTEIGNKICVELPLIYTAILGHVLFENNDLLLFLKGTDHDALVIQTHNCELEYILKSSCLNFNEKYPIDVEYRLFNGCERVIYFTDGLNPVRYINIDSLQDHLNSDILNDNTLPTNNLKIIYANQNDGWDCQSFNIFPEKSIPNILLERVNESGGRLVVGSYSFSIRYLDENLNPTPWFYVTKPVAIYSSMMSQDYNKIIGGINGSSQNININASGDNAVPPTNKSITLNITDLDTRFPYYQLAVIEYTDNNEFPTNVYKLYQSIITSANAQYTYTGVNSNIDESTTIDEVLAQFPDIQTAKHIVQQDNRIYYANTTGKKIKWEKFQQQASKIYTKYKTTRSSKNEIDDFVSKNPNTYFYKTSYMRDEIYALGIVWVFKDGTFSPVFHIPGRPANIDPSTCVAFSNVFGTVTKKCLKISVNVISEGELTFDEVPCTHILVLYTIKYMVDGVLYTKSSGFIPSANKKVPIHCITDINADIYVVDFTYEVDNTANPNQSVNCEFTAEPIIEIDTQTINYGNNELIPNIINYDPANPIITGIDNSVILTWTPDIAHIYPIEEDYNALDSENKLRVWQVYNTAYKDGEDSGFMAYHECTNNTYPNIRTCDGKSIWGTDVCGNELIGSPIRHHKFPDALLEPIQDSENIYNIGIEFFNIIPPQEYADQVSHFIMVRDIREESNKTVVDKGMVDRFIFAVNEEDDDTPVWDSELNEWLYFRSRTSVDNDTKAFNTQMQMISAFTPKSMFQRLFFGADYIKFERKYLDKKSAGYRYINNDQDSYYYCDNLNDNGAGGNDDKLDIYNFNDAGSSELRAFNRKISTAKYIDKLNPGLPSDNPVSIIIDNQKVMNYLGSIHLYANKLTHPINDFPIDFDSPDWEDYLRFAGPLYYAAFKRYKDVYCNLEALRYIMISDSPIKYNIDNTVCFGGDIFISRMEWSLQDWDATRAFMSSWIESEINSELRHSDGTVAGTRFLANPTDPEEVCKWITRYIKDPDWLQYIENDEIAFNGFVCADPLFYNNDFSYIEPAKFFLSLPLTFDYCNDCINYHPYRIWASEQSFQEERIDNYKTVLANNYIDILGNHGEITNIFVDKDRFFIHTEKDIWQLQTRPYQIKTTESDLYVGTGDIFSIPPKRLVNTNYGYGGSVDKWATVTTEQGTFYVDRNSHKIFLLTDGLEEISQNGLRNWSENTLDLFYVKDFENLTGIEYPFASNTNSFYNVGYSAVYDPRYRRYILHKQDFKFTKKLKSLYGGIFNPNKRSYKELVNKIVYDSVNKLFGFLDSDGNITPLNLLDKTLFINKSWTLSYSILNKAWASFHGYQPNYMYNDHNNFFSYNSLFKKEIRPNSDYVNCIWEHNTGPVTTYYNTKHAFFVDFVNNDSPMNNKYLESLQYLARVEEYDTNNDQFIEITNSPLSAFYAYTTDQITSTNEIKLYSENYESISYNPTQSLATRWLNQFSISKNFRDIAINRNSQSLFTSEWDDVNFNSNFDVDGIGNGWVDKVPNEQARDINKDVYQRAKLRDKWLGMRIFYKPEQDYRLSLQSIIMNKDLLS